MNYGTLQDFAVKKRKQLHQTPETGFTEFITTYEIYQEIKDTDFQLHIGRDILVSDKRMGIPGEEKISQSRDRALAYGVPETFLRFVDDGHTGIVAVLDTQKPGSHTALRFDIDGLPINESEADSHIPESEGFRSLHSGEMHACGHDGHAAIGISVVKFINDHQEKLSGKFTIIFQPAEEGGRGARSVVEKGWLDDTDYFISGHLGIGDHPAGTISATSKDFLASTKFDVEFKGKSAHAGVEPNEGKNAILAASTAVLNLNAIPRHRDGSTRINTGVLKAGSGRNVIPDTAHMMMETRGATSELNDYMYHQAERIMSASAAMYDLQADIKFMGHAPAACCSEEFIDIVKAACKDNSDIDEIHDVLPLGASEDATYMLNRVIEKGGKATYMVFASPLQFGHHHPEFDIAEHSIRTFVSSACDIIKYLNGSG
ncbi:amidohydrolase [Salinicoccus albus]|uniref:amidohydrolase n=1 Tax=Salinicoccus albus TaxID=418756 RepID=UPI000366A6DC|nr:amidohydrolase [Salinicoccus albus]